MMDLRGESRTLRCANDTNKTILEHALQDHDKHYWCLCRWVEREIAKPKRSRRWWGGPEAISEVLGEGFTAATVIWETYERRAKEA